jgi:hypothetical protein
MRALSCWNIDELATVSEGLVLTIDVVMPLTSSCSLSITFERMETLNNGRNENALLDLVRIGPLDHIFLPCFSKPVRTFWLVCVMLQYTMHKYQEIGPAQPSKERK